MSAPSDEPGRLPYPLAGLATALRVVLLVAAVLSAVLAYLAVAMRTALEDVDRSGDLVTNAAHDATARFFDATSLFFTTLVGIGALFVVWQYRAARNNQSFGRPGTVAPWVALVGWFIPIGSLVLPGFQLHQLWKGADGAVPRGDRGWRDVPTSVVLWAWWVAYVAGQVALVVAATLGAATVVGLTRRQEATATALGPPVYGALPRGLGRPSPAAWHPDPTGRFDQRWWDGALWTEHVMRGDEQTVDPEPL
jgi:hypothetical protein